MILAVISDGLGYVVLGMLIACAVILALLALTGKPEAEGEPDIDWRNDLPDRWRLP